MKTSGFPFMLLITIFFLNSTLQAQQMRVSSIKFGTDVQERELVGEDTVFVHTVGTVYCYTRVKGATRSREVVHIWYYKSQPLASITLPVESNNWRTWSSKNIRKDWTGSWRVIVEDDNGNILTNKAFTVESRE